MTKSSPGWIGPDESGLTWLLVVVLMANLSVMAYAMAETEQFRQLVPGLTDELLAILIGFAGMNLAGAVGLLRRRWWGAAGLLVGLVGVTVVAILARAPVAHTVLGPVGILLIGLFVWPVRDRLR